MIRKAFKKRTSPKKVNRAFLLIRFAIVGVLVGVMSVFGLSVNDSFAQIWSEPAGAPPSNNVSAPIWNQTSTAQSGSFYVNGKGRFDTAATGDATCVNGKVCGADNASAAGVVGQSNAGYGVYAASTSNYGLVATSSTNYAGYFSGNVYTFGTLSATSTISQGGVAVCLQNGTNCPSSSGYWTASGNNIYNNNTANVGVGTASPLAKLSVVGDSGLYSASGTTAGSPVGGSLYIGDSNFYNGSYYNSAPGLSAVYSPATGVGGDLAFYTYTGAANSRSEKMRILSNGNIGIGTTTPQGRMQVNLTKTNSGTVVNEVGDYADAFVISTGASSNNGDKIPLVFNVGNPTSPHISSVIEAGREASGWNTYLAFYTNNITSGAEGVDAIQEKMRITSAGYVGIGTAAPAYQLHVYGSGVFGGNNSLIYFPNDTYRASPGTNNSSMLGRADNNDYHVTGSLAGDIVLGSVNGGLTLGTSNSVTYPTARLRITNTGNVGIGVNSANYPLQVNGVIYASGTIYSNGWAVCQSNGANCPSSGSISGSGSTNYLAKFTGASSIGNSIVYDNGSAVGIGTTSPGGVLDARGAVFVGSSNSNQMIKFTNGWSGYPDSSSGSEISNDTGTYKTLMIIGNSTGGLGRRVSVWDRLEVNGTLVTTGTAYANGYALCQSNGANCPSSGGISGGGTANYVARFTGPTSIGNSTITDNGTNVAMGTSPTSPYRLYVSGSQRLVNSSENQALSISSPYVGIIVASDGFTITAVPTEGAIYAASDSGTYAINGDNASSGAGVYGSSYNGYGLQAYSTNNYGVYGQSGSPSSSAYGFYTPNSSFVSKFLVVGGASFLPSAGDIVAARGASSGVVYLGSNGSHYLYFDGTQYNMPNGSLITGNGPAGYYQDALNGAYRAISTSGNMGYFFQNYNGGSTRMYVGLNGSYAGRVGINTSDPSYNFHVEGNAYVSSGIQSGGNLTFSSANPYISTGGSYFIAPGGAYFNSGIVYFEAQAQFRGGIHNDASSYLEIYGGTSNITRVSGSFVVTAGASANSLTSSTWISASGSISAGTSISAGGSLSVSGVTYAYSNVFNYANLVVSGAASFGGGYTAVTGDIGTSRSDGSGVIYLGSVNNRYVYYSGSYYEMPGVPLYVNGTYYASDSRLKKNIAELSDAQGLDIIKDLRPVSYNWIDKTADQAKQYGFVAQDVQKIMPDLVSVKKDGMLNLNYEGLLAPMVKAIQEQQRQIEDLKSQIAELKK